MKGRVTRPQAKKIGEYDTWSYSLMSHKGLVSERRRAFFFGLSQIKDIARARSFALELRAQETHD